MNYKLKFTLFPILFIVAMFFIGESVVFGADISANTTFTLDDASVAAETGYTLTFDTSATIGIRDQVRIDFSAFGTSSTDFDLSNVSTVIGNYNFSNFGTVASHVGSVDMSSGYTGWTASPEDFNITVNGVGPTNVVLNTDTSDMATTVAEINNELSTAGVTGVEAFANGNNVGIRTISPGSSQNFVLAAGAPDALATLGWTANTYTGTDDDPDTVTVNNGSKTITFTGCTIDANINNVSIQYVDSPGSHYLRNDIDAGSADVAIYIGGFTDNAFENTTINANQANSVTVDITSPDPREAIAGSTGISVTYQITTTAGTADTFKINNPFTDRTLFVTSVNIDGTAQFLQYSQTRPNGVNQTVWYYDSTNDRLEIRTRKSAVFSDKSIEVIFQFDAPTTASTSNNFTLYSFEDSQAGGGEGTTEDTTNITNGNVDFDIVAGTGSF